MVQIVPACRRTVAAGALLLSFNQRQTRGATHFSPCHGTTRHDTGRDEASAASGPIPERSGRSGAGGPGRGAGGGWWANTPVTTDRGRDNLPSAMLRRALFLLIAGLIAFPSAGVVL